MRKRPRIILVKKLKDKHGAYLGETDKEKGVIKINMRSRAHKDSKELASTVKHELFHARYPNMTEKEVYKRSAKTKLSPQEQNKMLAKIRSKKINHKVGAMKRKFKIPKSHKMEPGDLISKSNEQKDLERRQKVAIMGLV